MAKKAVLFSTVVADSCWHPKDHKGSSFLFGRLCMTNGNEKCLNCKKQLINIINLDKDYS